MRGKTSTELLFDAKIERTFHSRIRQAKLVRLASEEDITSIHSEHQDTNLEHHSEYQETESDSKTEKMGENPPERLLGDYGGRNASAGRLTIVNHPVNVPNFQLHLSTITQLERRSFLRRLNEDANKHLQRFLIMSTTLKIDGHTEEQKKLRMFPFTLDDGAEE